MQLRLVGFNLIQYSGFVRDIDLPSVEGLSSYKLIIWRERIVGNLSIPCISSTQECTLDHMSGNTSVLLRYRAFHEFLSSARYGIRTVGPATRAVISALQHTQQCIVS